MGYYRSTPDPNVFYHHGTLGMHWGIRRYQSYPSDHTGGKEIGEAAKLKASENAFKVSCRSSSIRCPRSTCKQEKGVINQNGFVNSLEV